MRECLGYTLKIKVHKLSQYGIDILKVTDSTIVYLIGLSLVCSVANGKKIIMKLINIDPNWKRILFQTN